MQGPERCAFAVDLAVKPRPHDQKILVVALVFRLYSEIAVNGAPHVFLIPQALQPDGRHGQRLRGHNLVERLRLPERIV